MAGVGEIFVVSAAGQGHLQPCMELCNHLLSRHYHTTIVIPSTLSSAIPSSFSQNPLAQILQLTASSGPPRPGPDPLRNQAAQDLDRHLANRPATAPRPLCAVIDFQMGWSKEVFWKFHVPVVGFFTFGACAAAMEWGSWKVQAGDIRPDEIRPIPGLPEEMALTISDLKRKAGGPGGPNRPPPGGPNGPPPGGPNGPPPGGPNGPPGGPGGPGGPPGGGGKGGGGPPKPGNRPPWVPEVEGSVALMFNTCDYLERPFIDYMTEQMGIPTWGVGPLLPESYWQSPSDSSIRHRQIRAKQRQSNYTEDDVVKWLDGKPPGSVLYVAFGSEVGPTAEEYPELAGALEESTGPFIWVIQPGSGGSDPSYGLESKVGERGLIIRGWAPQLLILSHPSTGGFLSHCGWNSTAEALGRGVPFLGWPVRGDQYFNAKLVVNHLKVGYRVAEDLSKMVRKEDVVRGIEKLMGDEEMKKRAVAIRRKFENGFPASSEAALDAFGVFITSRKAT